MNKVGNMVVGFLAGVTAGIVTGVLIAPHKGEKSRKILRNKVKDASKDVTDKIGEQIDHLEGKIRNLMKKVDDGAEVIQEATAKVKARTEK